MRHEIGHHGAKLPGLFHLVKIHDLAVDDHRAEAAQHRIFRLGALQAAEKLVDGRVAVAVRQQLHPLPGGADEGRFHLGIGHGAVAAVAVYIVFPQPGGTPLG